ncbi:MAG: TatD family hydrolase [Verrucomicrobia bacterium]|nr:TatD family hydrolase [Verrucomicrobiota bacterium]
MNLYDAHNHLQDAWLTPHRELVFRDLASAGVMAAVVNGTCETDWAEVAELAAVHPVVRPSYGLHPWDAGNRSPDWQSRLVARLDANPNAAVGEIGIDRWILERAKPDDPRLAGLRRAPLAEQMEVFLWQLDLAVAGNRPVSIHCLDAHGALLEALAKARRPERGFLLHAYNGSVELMHSFAKLGAYFSFNGSFLDPRKERLRPVYTSVPADRLLVETDAPAMRLPVTLEEFFPLATPEGLIANHPANLRATYRGLAAWRGTVVGQLAEQVEVNFWRLFG